MFDAVLSVLFCLLLSCPVGEVAADVSVASVKKTVSAKAVCDAIPSRACPHIDYLLQSNNPSREAAQTDQESAFNPLARSPYAYGLRQFTPATGKDMARGLCKDLGPFSKYDVEWQMLCGLRYMTSLEKSSKMPGYCLNRKVAEQRYNGGYWVVWELKTAKSTILSKARDICGKRLFNGRKRALWACKENYEYPERISKRQNNFTALGGQLCA